MIGRLKGTLADKQPPWLLVDVNGVGYEVEAPMSTVFDLPPVGQAVTLYTHLAVREDAQQLFGFGSEAERTLFRTLIKISGVGGKLALAILSGMPTDEFVRVVEEGDAVRLTKLPGVGKKTAERLIIELRGKTDSVIAPAGQAAASRPASPAADARDALIALGYKANDAKKMVDAVDEPGLDSEALIRKALKASVR